MTNSQAHSDRTGGPVQIPQWRLERYLLSELPSNDMEAVERALAYSAELRQRLDALRQDNGEVLGRYPAAWMARQIEARAAGPARDHTSRGAAAWWWRLAPVAAVTLVALAVLPIMEGGEVAEGPASVATLEAGSPGVRLKGSPYLVVHRRTATGSERLENGAAAYAGDLILVQYHGAGRRYGAILSVDGRGDLTFHLPAEGTMAAALDDSGLATLGYSYELDDAPRWERFYFVTADRRFRVDEVASAARRIGGSGTLDLPAGLEQYAFGLDKDAAPQVSAANEVDGR